MSYYKNKVAIVTGGASGLGKNLSMELASQGAKLLVVDIDQEKTIEVVESICEAGGEAIHGYLDVTIYENAVQIVKDAVHRYGRLDFIFNNAGTAVQGETRDLSVKHWRTVMDVNTMGVIYGSISAYDVMAEQGAGHIVNISSLAGLIPIPKEIPYCTSKWAIVGFSSSLRVEGADLGVRVNLVCPGVMDTPIYDNIPWVNVEKKKILPPHLFKFFMSPSKAAKVILKGVEKNKAIIVFPLYARFLWLLYRVAPFCFHFVFKKVIRDFRKKRISQ